MVCWTDTRTKAGQARRPMAFAKATELRGQGYTWGEIAPIVGMSPATLSLYCRDCASSEELMDRRVATKLGLDAVTVTELRRADQTRRFRVRQQKKRTLKRRRIASKRYHKTRRNRALLYARWKEQDQARRLEVRFRWDCEQLCEFVLREHECRRKVARGRQTRWGQGAGLSPLSLDAPLRAAPGITLGDTLAARILDPHEEFERNELRVLIGNITEQDVARMGDEVLERLQDRLRDAGYAGRGRSVTADERRRVAAPIRKELRRGRNTEDSRYQPLADPDEYEVSGHATKSYRRQMQRRRKAAGGKKVHGLRPR